MTRVTPAGWRREIRSLLGRQAPRQQRSPDSWRLPARSTHLAKPAVCIRCCLRLFECGVPATQRSINQSNGPGDFLHRNDASCASCSVYEQNAFHAHLFRCFSGCLRQIFVPTDRIRVLMELQLACSSFVLDEPGCIPERALEQDQFLVIQSAMINDTMKMQPSGRGEFELQTVWHSCQASVLQR